jgi:hypothetical protein
MKMNAIRFCALVLLATQSVTFGQRTEVRVEKGTVVAETDDATVEVGAGRKAVLTPSGRPAVSVDNPLVSDAMELYKLAEAEKARGDLQIDSVFMLVGTGDEDSVHGALYFEFPHWGSAPTDVLTLPSVSIIPGLEVYDLNGNRLTVDTRLVSDTTASYTIHLEEPVPTGGYFKLIGVANLEDIPLIPGGAPAYYKEGPVWYFRTINQAQNCLNYFRLILPASAILLDANHQVIATDTVDGRVAVTVRNYTGQHYDGTCIVAFLWPDHDGTTLADVPPKYLGLRDARDRELAETYERELNLVRAGRGFHDQSTPVSALLSACSAATHQILDDYRNLLYDTSTEDEARSSMEQSGYYAGVVTLLEVPQWPREPEDGYLHPVFMSREDSLIHEFTILLAYREGKWYVYGTRWPVLEIQAEESPDRVESAEAQGYVTDWEVAGPYVQDGKTHAELFDTPFGPEDPERDILWRPIETEMQGDYPAYVNLDRALYGGDQMIAYLRTTIQSSQARSARLEIYTDDGVKAWLNGKLIHANNVSRGIGEPPDAVDVTLRQGANELLLKVTDDILAWGAVVRLRPAGEEIDQG